MNLNKSDTTCRLLHSPVGCRAEAATADAAGDGVPHVRRTGIEFREIDVGRFELQRGRFARRRRQTPSLASTRHQQRIAVLHIVMQMVLMRLMVLMMRMQMLAAMMRVAAGCFVVVRAMRCSLKIIDELPSVCVCVCECEGFCLAVTCCD